LHILAKANEPETAAILRERSMDQSQQTYSRIKRRGLNDIGDIESMIGERYFVFGVSVPPRKEARLQNTPSMESGMSSRYLPLCCLETRYVNDSICNVNIREVKRMGWWSGGALVDSLFRKAGASFYEGVSTSPSMLFPRCQLLIVALPLNFSELSVYYPSFGLSKRYGTRCGDSDWAHV
jgi:hypothetical protein